MNAVMAIGHNSLTLIRGRIVAAHERAERGGAEWINGSIELALAMREGRELMNADIDFGNWLKTNHLDWHNAHDRIALIHMAADPELMRKVLGETDSRSYRVIWERNRNRYGSPTKPNKPPRRRNTSRANLHREMKLGIETLKALRGTSLDTAIELDELIMLNRGAPEGEHTPVVKQLIADAVAGKVVSAIALTETTGTHIRRRASSDKVLLQAWTKRMAAPWNIAKPLDRIALIRKLVDDLPEIARNEFIGSLTKGSSNDGQSS